MVGSPRRHVDTWRHPPWKGGHSVAIDKVSAGAVRTIDDNHADSLYKSKTYMVSGENPPFRRGESDVPLHIAGGINDLYRYRK